VFDEKRAKSTARKLSEVVFGAAERQKSARTELEAIVHPRIRHLLSQRIAEAKFILTPRPSFSMPRFCSKRAAGILRRVNLHRCPFEQRWNKWNAPAAGPATCCGCEKKVSTAGNQAPGSRLRGRQFPRGRKRLSRKWIVLFRIDRQTGLFNCRLTAYNF